MPLVFLSYAKKDHFFAELADIKLREKEIDLWRDQGQLRAGTDWHRAIETAISDSLAVIVALSANSAESSYVTFEWAYALGKGKAIIPVKLDECSIHSRLATIQYLDFSIPGAMPWASLIERVLEIETDEEPRRDSAPDIGLTPAHALDDSHAKARAKAILDYLNERGFQMASFERLRGKIGEPLLTDEQFYAIISENPGVFRRARLRGGKPGIAKTIP
jgi:hypothetical protein